MLGLSSPGKPKRKKELMPCACKQRLEQINNTKSVQDKATHFLKKPK